MSFEDLDEFLQQNLGYGNAWSSSVFRLAVRQQVKKQTVTQQGIKRLQKFHKQNPKAYYEARRRWQKNRIQMVRHRSGKQPCNRCSKLMVIDDLIGQNRLPGFCLKCRKELI